MPSSATPAAFQPDGSVATGQSRKGRSGCSRWLQIRHVRSPRPGLIVSQSSAATTEVTAPVAKTTSQPPCATSQRRDEGGADHAAEVAAGVEGRGRRHGVVRREPHRDPPVVALVELDAGEAEAERGDRPVGMLDRRRSGRGRRAASGSVTSGRMRAPVAVAEAPAQPVRDAPAERRRRRPRRRTAARRASRSRARTVSGPAPGTGSSRTSRGRRRSSSRGRRA